MTLDHPSLQAPVNATWHPVFWNSQMGLSLSKEQMGTKDACRRFTDEVIIPGAEELEAEDYPYRIMDGMAESGMMGIPFPGEYGGSGGDWVSLALCMKKSPGVMPASA